MGSIVSWLGIAMALASTPLGITAKAPPKTWALVFGIDAYRGEPLPNCVNDAKDVAVAVAARGLDRGNLRILLDRAATREAMLAELRAFVARVGADGEGFVYFSGHGTRAVDLNGDETDGFDEAWLAVDLRPVLDDEIEAILRPVGSRVLVIADSCHSGTVTKSLELPDPSAGLEVVSERDGQLETTRIDGRKFVSPARLEQLRAMEAGRPLPPLPSDEPGVTARDIGVTSSTAIRNAAGGSASRPHAVEAGDARLFAACSDQESANATAGRNSAFTGELLAVLRLAPARRTFGGTRDTVDARLRNRALRHPQHPAIAGVDSGQPLPWYLQEAGQQTAEAVRSEARVDARQTLSRIVEGIFRREDAGQRGQQPLVAEVGTGNGRTEVVDGDHLVLKLRVAADAPARVFPCVVNVGPTGNLTLLYPNFEDRSEPLAPGATLTIGAPPSKVVLPVGGAKGRETVVAYLLEWDAFAGVDWSTVTTEDQKLLSLGRDDCLSSAPRVADARASMVRPRDIGVASAPARPGESFARSVLTLEHR